MCPKFCWSMHYVVIARAKATLIIFFKKHITHKKILQYLNFQIFFSCDNIDWWIQDVSFLPMKSVLQVVWSFHMNLCMLNSRSGFTFKRFSISQQIMLVGLPFQIRFSMHTKTIYSFCKERENSLAVRLTVCQSCTEITVHGETLNIRRQM